MEEYESLNHTNWKCKYHVGFVSKYRRKPLHEELRKYVGEMFHGLAKQMESGIRIGYLLSDPHVHMIISIALWAWGAGKFSGQSYPGEAGQFSLGANNQTTLRVSFEEASRRLGWPCED